MSPALMLLPLLAAAPASTFRRAAPPSAHEAELAQRVAELEARVAQLEAQLAAQGGTTPGADEEARARAIYADAVEAYDAGRFDEAKALLATLEAELSGTRSHRMAQRIVREVAAVGRPIPADWADHIETWYTRPRRLDLAQGLVVVLYWEAWCPHCKREIPKWEQTWQQHRADGLQVVGLTRITRSSTEASATAFISETGITFPMAKEDGALAEAVDVSGIPAAAVYRDGEVVWRGHPARIDDTLLRTWLQLP